MDQCPNCIELNLAIWIPSSRKPASIFWNWRAKDRRRPKDDGRDAGAKGAGDGAGLTGERKIAIRAGMGAEVLVFDL